MKKGFPFSSSRGSIVELVSRIPAPLICNLPHLRLCLKRRIVVFQNTLVCVTSFVQALVSLRGIKSDILFVAEVVSGEVLSAPQIAVAEWKAVVLPTFTENLVWHSCVWTHEFHLCSLSLMHVGGKRIGNIRRASPL